MRKAILVAGLVAMPIVAGLIGVRVAIAQNNESYSLTLRGMQKTLSKTDVEAPPEVVFAVVDDVRSWSRWTWPYEGDIKRTFSGPAKGKGAVYEWDSAGAGGSGRAEIKETSAPGRIVVDLDLKKPTAGHLTWVFEFERFDGKTRVSLSTSGPFRLVSSSFETLLGTSPNLTRLGCVAGGEPYKGWCEVFMVKIPALQKKRAQENAKKP